MTTGTLRFLAWIASATLAFIVFIAWFDAAAACKNMPIMWLPGNRCTLVKFLYDWQQLLGALLALAAAAIGWVAINRQIRLADEQERERLRRRHDAARAMLPLALSAIAGYADQCAMALRQVYVNRDGTFIRPWNVPWKHPSVPSTATAGIRDMVETSEIAVSRPLARILSRIQLQASRLQTLSHDLQAGAERGSVFASNVEQFFVDAIEIHTLVSSAFRFARGEVDHIAAEEPTLEMMFNGLMSLGMLDSQFDAVRERIERQYRSRQT